HDIGMEDVAQRVRIAVGRSGGAGSGSRASRSGRGPGGRRGAGRSSRIRARLRRTPGLRRVIPEPVGVLLDTAGSDRASGIVGGQLVEDLVASSRRAQETGGGAWGAGGRGGGRDRGRSAGGGNAAAQELHR